MKIIQRLLIAACVLLWPVTALGQGIGVRFDGFTLSPSGRPVSGNVAVCSTPGLSTTSAIVIGNTAILSFATSPITAGFAANMPIVVSGFTGSDTFFNVGTMQPFSSTTTITAVGPGTITFPLNHANATAGTLGSVFQMGNTSTPCAPLAPIYSDSNLAFPITQPGFTSSGVGNFGFYVSPGSYAIQYYGSGVQVYIQPLTLTMAFTNVINTFTAPQVFAGIGPGLFSGIDSLPCPASPPPGGSLCLEDSILHQVMVSNNGGPWQPILSGRLVAGPGATPTIDTQKSALIASGGGVVTIAQGYNGPESVDCSTHAPDGNNVYSGNPIVTIIDERSGSSVCSYSVSFNSATSLGLAPLAVTKYFVSPSTTASAIICTAKYTTNLFAGGGNLNGCTSEVDVIGTLTAAPTATVTANIGQASVRSNGFAIPDLAVYSGLAGIDRAGTTTNVTRAYAYLANACVNASGGSAVIGACYGLYTLHNTAGVINYAALFSGKTRFGYFAADNGIDMESTGGAATNILTNDGTDALVFKPLSDTVGFVFKNAAGTLTRLAIGANTSGIQIGGGSALNKYYVVSGAITPAATAANTCAEQSFTPAAFNTVINAGDNIYITSSATMAGNGVSPVLGARAIANGVDITYCNSTAGPLTAPAVTITVTGTR